MDFKRILFILKIILQVWIVLIKSRPSFLKKIHFKKVKKDHEEEMLFKKKKKKKIQNQNLPQKLQIYIKWTTNVKTLTVR